MNISTPTTASGRGRKRAVEACTFCRLRKIKCNNEQPVCANCRTYGKDCIYEPLGNSQSLSTGRTRVSQFRRAKNAQIGLGSRVRRDLPEIDTHTRTSEQQPSSENQTSTAELNRRTPPLSNSSDVVLSPVGSRATVFDNRISSYHGRTSALFDDNIQDRPPEEFRPRMSDDWVEKGLVAEAAKQRQLEELNFRIGKLDFDTVDPELGMHLLTLHWNRQHHSFLITYRPAFTRDMACGGPYFSKLLLNAIYFGSAKFSPRLELRKDPNDPRTAGWRFRERVRELLGGSLDRSDITTIQALLVMTNSLFALGDERNAAWLYSGLAFRMIIDLGIHVDVADGAGIRKFSDEDMEIRRRVFWGAFVVDKIQSLYQGRPASLRESDALVPIKFLDTFEEFEYWVPFAYSPQSNPYPGSPAYSVSTFTCLCKLSVTMSDILDNIYTEHRINGSSVDLTEILHSLHSRLATWKTELPSHLVVDTRGDKTYCPPPHVLSLHAMYYVLIILLHRPFVTDGHLYNTSRSISVNSFIECASAATKIVALLRIYDRNFSVRRAPYLISYATYVAATVHARIAAKRERTSWEHRNLETCLAVFSENQETNWAVKRANLVIRNLAKRLGIFIKDELRIHVDEGTVSEGISVAITDQDKTAACQERPNNEIGPIGTPSKDWLNIDEIIQSFVREAIEHGVSQNNTFQPPFPMLQPNTNLMRRETITHQLPQSMEVGHEITPSRPRDENTSQQYAHGSAWQSSRIDTMDGTGSIDDLLFGFNGPALDDFPIIDWDPM